MLIWSRTEQIDSRVNRKVRVQQEGNWFQRKVTVNRKVSVNRKVTVQQEGNGAIVR